MGGFIPSQIGDLTELLYLFDFSLFYSRKSFLTFFSFHSSNHRSFAYSKFENLPTEIGRLTNLVLLFVSFVYAIFIVLWCFCYCYCLWE